MHALLEKAKSLYEPSGPWSRLLSPVSVVLSRWESMTPPGRDTNPSQFSSQQTLVLIYLPWKDESWVSLGGKEGYTNIQITVKPESNRRRCGRKAEILPIAPIMPALAVIESVPRIARKIAEGVIHCAMALQCKLLQCVAKSRPKFYFVQRCAKQKNWVTICLYTV